MKKTWTFLLPKPKIGHVSVCMESISVLVAVEESIRDHCKYIVIHSFFSLFLYISSSETVQCIIKKF